MAVPLFSGIGIVDMQRSIGNTTFSRNAFGTYSKTKIGAPAMTPFLSAWQSIYSGIYFDWRNILADTDRELWYKFSIRSKGMFANVTWRNGFDAFMFCNLSLALISIPPIYTPPPSYKAPNPPNLLLLNASTINLQVFQLSGLPFLQYVLVYMSNQLPPSRMSMNQIFAFMGWMPLGGGGSDFIIPWTARYGAPVVGNKIFLRVCSIDPTTGLRSSSQYASAIVV